MLADDDVVADVSAGVGSFESRLAASGGWETCLAAIKEIRESGVLTAALTDGRHAEAEALVAAVGAAIEAEVTVRAGKKPSAGDRESFGSDYKLGWELGREPGTDLEVWSEMYAEAATEVIGEVRELGGEFHLHHRSGEFARFRMSQVAALTPADWIARSNEDSEPLHVHGGSENRRDHHQRGKQIDASNIRKVEWEPRTIEYPKDNAAAVKGIARKALRSGQPEQIRKARSMNKYMARVLGYRELDNGNVEVTFEGGVRDARKEEKEAASQLAPETVTELTVYGPVGTAIHETMHRFESTVPGIKELQSEFWDRQQFGNLRSKGPADDRVQEGSGLVCDYATKKYDTGHFEVLAVGAEHLFGGDKAMHDDSQPATNHRSFVLGVFATV